MLLACCALAAAAGQLGRVWPRADAWNYAAPLWLIVGLPGAAAALSAMRRGRWPIAAATVLLLACGADRIAPEVLARIERPTAPGPADLRLIQFNLMRDNRDPAATAAWIAARHPDVVVVEEADLAASTIPRLLAADLPYQASCFARRPCSTMILSRRRFRAVVPLGRGDPENHNGPSLLMVALDGPGGPFVVLGIHLDHPWPADRQRTDLAVLAKVLARVPRAGAILAGDFNMPSWAFDMARQDRDVALPRLTRALPTWPARFGQRLRLPPLLPLDHVYAGGAWRAVRVVAGPTLGSDHRPVIVDLRWVAPPAPPAASPSALACARRSSIRRAT